MQLIMHVRVAAGVCWEDRHGSAAWAVAIPQIHAGRRTTAVFVRGDGADMAEATADCALFAARIPFFCYEGGGPSQVQHCSPPSGSGGGKPATSDVEASKIAVLSFPLFPLKVKILVSH